MLSLKSAQVSVYCFQQQEIRTCGVLCLPSKKKKGDNLRISLERNIFLLAYTVFVTFTKKRGKNFLPGLFPIEARR